MSHDPEQPPSDERQPQDGHDWVPVPDNELNFKCKKCGIVGYITYWHDSPKIRSSHDCDDYLTLFVMSE